MSDCPYKLRLCAYHDGELAPDSVADLDRHLDDCNSCRSQLEEMRELTTLLAPTRVERLSGIELARLHQAIDRSDDRSILRLASAVSAIAASILIVSTVWLYDGPRSSGPLDSHDQPVTSWERLATTGQFEAPAGVHETGVAERSTTDWMLRVTRGRDDNAND